MEVFPARLLMLHVENFWYRPNIAKSNQGKEIGESLHVLIHSEDRDKNNRSSVLRKMVKNIRWLAKKIDCNNVTLHSFAHLSDSKSDPDFADSLIMDVASKLRERNYKVNIVPFGAFYEFKMHVKGPSLAKVFKSF